MIRDCYVVTYRKLVTQPPGAIYQYKEENYFYENQYLKGN